MNRTTTWIATVATSASALLGAGVAHAGALEPVVVESVVHAPIQDVWDAMWDEDARAWMTPSCDIDLRAGGLIKCSYTPNADLDGPQAIHHEILSMEPGRRMVTTLIKGPDDFPHTKAMLGSTGIFEFDPIGDRVTAVRSVTLDLPDTPEGRSAREYFEGGNAYTFDALKEHLEEPGVDDRADRIMQLLGDIAGGEWIHEGQTPDGAPFLVRNVIRKGPDGVSLIATGWLGFGRGMFDHGPTLVWKDSDHVVRFRSVHETGATGDGVVRLTGDDSVLWEWTETTLEGTRTRFDIGMTFSERDRYSSTMEIVHDNGVRAAFGPPLIFERVDAAPVRFRTLLDGRVLPASTTHDPTKKEARMAPAETSIELAEVIAAPVADVWRSWTTSEGASAFLGTSTNIECRVGGPFEIYWVEDATPGERGSEGCTVLSYDPERVFSFTWNSPPSFPNVRRMRTHVVLGFEPVSESSTRVTLTHLGWDDLQRRHPEHATEIDGVREYFTNAWPRVLAALKDHHARSH